MATLRKKPLVQADSWETIFGVGYLVLGTNAMLVLASAPLVVLLMTTEPEASWPALCVTAVAATPGVAAAFAVFRRFSLERSAEVIRGFWTAWVRHLRRSLALGVLAVGGAAIVSVDVGVLAEHRYGALATPLLLVLLVLLLGTTLLALVASVERPEARLRDVLKASLFLGVRRWYLTAVSFIALGSLGALFVQSPALALGVAATPLLYAAWGNSRYSLRPVLPEGSAVQLG